MTILRTAPLLTNVTIAAALGMSASGALADQTFSGTAPIVSEHHSPIKQIAHPAVASPAYEQPSQAALANNSGFSTPSAFATSEPLSSKAGTALTPPLTVTYTGTVPVLLVTQNGTNRGVEADVKNAKNSSSAFYGSTNGSGAGITGYNSGTGGPAGKFGIANTATEQPAVSAFTNGLGSAVLGTVTTSKSNAAALWGQNMVTADWGIGVDGDGNWIGVSGYSPAGDGVYGQSYSGYGVIADGQGTAVGLYANGAAGTAIQAISEGTSDPVVTVEANSNGAGDGIDVTVDRGTGIDVQSDSGTALLAHATGGVGLNVASDSGYAVDARSTNSYAIHAKDFGSGTGVYGTSVSGWAGYFDGKLWATTVSTSSDRNVKTNIRNVDGKVLLNKVTTLPVSSWAFKTEPDKTYVGPMAQDFHAAFGLDGDDDKHINMTDIAGINLAALQELAKEVKRKDAAVAAQLANKDAKIASITSQLARSNSEITALRQQLRSMTTTFNARMTVLEQQRQQIEPAAQTASLR